MIRSLEPFTQAPADAVKIPAVLAFAIDDFGLPVIETRGGVAKRLTIMSPVLSVDRRKVCFRTLRHISQLFERACITYQGEHHHWAPNDYRRKKS